MTYLLIPLYALLFRFAGSDWGGVWTSKYLLCAVAGAVAGLLVLDAYTALIVFAGLAVWRGPGWGTGFAAQYGVWKGERQGAEGIRNGVLWMTARGLLLLPLFLALAWYQAQAALALFGLIGALQGVVYWLPARLIAEDAMHRAYARFRREGESFRTALLETVRIPGAASEALMGALIGAGVAYCIGG